MVNDDAEKLILICEMESSKNYKGVKSLKCDIQYTYKTFGIPSDKEAINKQI